MRPWVVSLSAYGGVSTRQALTVFAQAGIQQVELAIGVLPDPTISIAIQEFLQQGMTFRAHHAFVWQDRHRPFNLAKSLDWDFLKRMIAWLVEHQIKAYSVHPGQYSRQGDSPDRLSRRAAAWHQFLDNLHQLQELCQSHHIALAVETMYPTPKEQEMAYFLDSLDSVQELRNAMPSIQWVVDLSHLHIWPCDRLEVWNFLADALLEVHISDNDGKHDHHTGITQHTWWLPWRDLIPLHVPVVLESRMNRWSSQAVQAECLRVQALLARSGVKSVRGAIAEDRIQR